MTKVKIIFPNDDPRWEYVRGAFPTSKEQARDCWMSISCSLAPESLSEDGELPYYLQKQKRRDPSSQKTRGSLSKGRARKDRKRYHYGKGDASKCDLKN